MKRRDDWIDDDEYPSERDVDDFGDDSPPDDHPLTIGYMGSARQQFWTSARIIIALIIALILAALLVPLL
jgi:hypothetical protein